MGDILGGVQRKMIIAAMENGKDVLTMTEYIENPLSGKLRGVTYEDGKIIDVHIRDTDDVVKVFVPVRHGRWVNTHSDSEFVQCCLCKHPVYAAWNVTNYCPQCGAKMDGGAD